MFSQQGGKCAICGSTQPGGKKRRFAVDHDHETGKVRGLLCYQCNLGLGHFKDDIKSLKKAIQYLTNQQNGDNSMAISYLTQWDAGDNVHGVPMLPVITPVPVAVDAKWTLSNFTIAATFLDASAVAAASYAQRYIPAVLEGHLHKLTVVVAALSGTATNEVQTVGIDNASSGGTFTLTYDGQTTAGIAYNAAAADVKSALELLSNINLVAVTGGAGPATDWIVEFQGTLAGQDVDMMVGDGALLTGGTTVVTVTETTPGAAIELVLTMGGKSVGSITAAGTYIYYVRPDDGLPLKVATVATATTASISSIVVQAVDPLNLDLLPPEVVPVQV